MRRFKLGTGHAAKSAGRIERAGRRLKGQSIDYRNENETQPFDVADILLLDQQYRHWDTFTKQTVRK